ncbi:pyridoxal phosphate-dependent decarboxylase family protein [Poritiphilus flavus]|uniref:Aminotransferase class I/II-fold pyridoxal phosphate-dependent enzyme n=1 Tax=Poritiphilus flavus TaxID=2697053 RepID=A0A6L9EB30_9FLAO|nr:aminotransferase class I/II-fold pyridoxal phosphate-dependent enzyme [Poritiphilus flavus]NAS11649.1 aminotransferase class I/II-fold pyridoxal phosphate-dependent enzyme [Poritiphilus flavus]
MGKDLLGEVYSPSDFRHQGHQLIDKLADHLEESLKGENSKVIDWKIPVEEHKFWKRFFKEGDPDDFLERMLEHTIHIHHPKYMGHQISPAAPITGLSGLLSAFMNNGMGIYEMGAAPTAMERVVTDMLCSTVGYPEGANGFLTSGGTLANLTALLSARKNKASHDVWNEGTKTNLAVMVSEEAHYCIDRAVRIMGLGENGIIKIPTNADFSIRTDKLEEAYQQAKENGLEVFAIVGSAPATATGIHDNLESLARFAQENGLWFHVDAAHGGGAFFSEKYKHLLSGAAMSDSVVIDGHKMMMMPGITTALLFRDGTNSHTTFRQKADYLLEASREEDWYNLAKRTFECTKHMMSLHWYMLLKQYGPVIFDTFVSTLYDLGHQFADLIDQHPDFELAVRPMTNILCFRYRDKNHDEEALNRINQKIRQQILEEGTFYIVQTKLRGKHYLRTTIMNPFTTAEHFRGLLENIKQKAEQLSPRN